MAKTKVDPNISRPRGRPRKVSESGEVEKKAKQAKVDTSTAPKMYKCTCCGTTYINDAVQRFFIVPQSTIYAGNDKYAPLCIKCANQFYNEYTTMYNSRKFALLLLCSMLGAYFSERLYESLAEKAQQEGEEVSLGQYLRYLNGNQYKGKTFLTYLVEMKNQDKTFIPADKMRELMDGNWSAGDRQNKNYIINTLGYDCFDDPSYTSEDRRYLYNTMSGYLTDDVLEDSHKVQAVISMVKSSLQVAQLDILINKNIKSLAPDIDAIRRMTATKTDLQHSINAIAKENAISAIGSGKKAKSTNQLTSIMKEMLDNGITEAKPNVMSAKMTEAYKHIAEINMRAITNELQFTGDDYAKMVADQSIVVASQAQEISEAQEEIRLLRIQLDEARQKGYAPAVRKTAESGVKPDADTEQGEQEGIFAEET